MNRTGYEVDFMEISSKMIQGYNQEEYTLLRVAAAQALAIGHEACHFERRAFREAVSKLKGYDVSVMGTVILEDE